MLATCLDVCIEAFNEVCFYQVLCFTSNFCPVRAHHGVLSPHNLPDQHHLFPVPERGSSYKKGVHYDPACPRVHLEPVTVALVLKIT